MGHPAAAEVPADVAPALLALKLSAMVEQALRLPPLLMYDSVDLDTIPREAAAVAGYVDGNWPTFTHLAAR